MPEGAEVARVAISLHERISGDWIYKIKHNSKSRYAKATDGIKNVDKLQFPLFISRIYPKGKKILFECIDSEKKKV